MITRPSFPLQTTRCFVKSLVLALALGSAQLWAADPTPKDASPSFTSEQTSALETLQRELARLDPMLGKIVEPEHKAWVASKMKKLKTRLEELRQNAFDQTKFDELRFDVNIEYQRLALWLRPPLAPAKTK